MLKNLILKLLGIEGPFNGWKTIAGLLLLLTSTMFPEASVADQQLLVATVGQLVEALGVVLTTVGAVHRAWKNIQQTDQK